MSQEKTIRFIDTNYRTLFTLPDGGNLRMIFPDGKSKVSRCRYVDEYHTEVAGRVYHICEFAGHMERGGIACAPEEPLPRQTDKQAFQERRFLRAPFGAYAIYQLTREEATHNLRFEPLEHLRAAGLAVIIWTAGGTGALFTRLYGRCARILIRCCGLTACGNIGIFFRLCHSDLQNNYSAGRPRLWEQPRCAWEAP